MASVICAIAPARFPEAISLYSEEVSDPSSPMTVLKWRAISECDTPPACRAIASCYIRPIDALNANGQRLAFLSPSTQ